MNVLVLRVSPSCNYSTHVIHSAVPSKVWVFFVAYQEHLRILIPLSSDSEKFLLNRPSTIARPLGWRHILEFPGNDTYIESKSLTRCPHCQAPNTRLPDGVFGTIVGRCMLSTDVQLREFSIEKPWTKLAAEDHSKEALECWLDEEETPLLDVPPECDDKTRKLVTELIACIPSEITPFDTRLWGRVAECTDKLVVQTGDVFKAAHLYVCEWRRTKSPTTLTPSGLKIFDGLVSKELFEYAGKVASKGVVPRGTSCPRGLFRNLIPP